jgi:hypothetical protein
VLRDLMSWHTRVGIDGVIQMNDCCHSADAVKLNFGVLPALAEFVKRTDFVPVLMTNTAWSDVVLARSGSRIRALLDDVVLNSNVPFVDIPHQLLAASREVRGRQRSNLSFL